MLFSGYFPTILDILSFISILFAVLVITVKNPIVSVLYLIGLFFAIACYLISIGMTFLGLSYLLVYVGAVSILFLFILMLINIRVSELASDTKNSIPLVFLITTIFANAGYTVFPLVNINNSLNNIVSSNWENNLVQYDHIASIGNIMYSNFAVLLIIVSIVLLLAMVGAIVITIKQVNASN
jgi:NADH-ubiquinone oxidoreductase chain 6